MANSLWQRHLFTKPFYAWSLLQSCFAWLTISSLLHVYSHLMHMPVHRIKAATANVVGYLATKVCKFPLVDGHGSIQCSRQFRAASTPAFFYEKVWGHLGISSLTPTFVCHQFFILYNQQIIQNGRS